MEDNFSDEEANEIIQAVDWEVWVKSPGLPPITLDFTTPELNQSSALADEYIDL